jgi:hypothetical protein
MYKTEKLSGLGQYNNYCWLVLFPSKQYLLELKHWHNASPTIERISGVPVL